MSISRADQRRPHTITAKGARTVLADIHARPTSVRILAVNDRPGEPVESITLTIAELQQINGIAQRSIREMANERRVACSAEALAAITR